MSSPDCFCGYKTHINQKRRQPQGSMRTGVVSYIAERGDFCRSEAILSRWVHCLQRVPPSVQFSTSLSLSAQVAKTPLCVQTVTSIVSKSQLGWFRGPLRVQFSLVDSSTSCLVDLPTWNLSIFAGRGGRPRQVPRPTLAVGEPD